MCVWVLICIHMLYTHTHTHVRARSHTHTHTHIIYIYRYIVCATGKTAEEMLAILQVNRALIGP